MNKISSSVVLLAAGVATGASQTLSQISPTFGNSRQTVFFISPTGGSVSATVQIQALTALNTWVTVDQRTLTDTTVITIKVDGPYSDFRINTSVYSAGTIRVAVTHG